jgi:hypothetical protein
LLQSGALGIINNEPVRIGTRKDGYSYFEGSIDDVRIYDYELRENEIVRVYEGLPVGDRFVCSGRPVADLNDDCMVNVVDYAIFALQWLSGP